MLRRVALSWCVVAFVACLGCSESDNKPANPDKLEYSKEGPPKRGGVPQGKAK
jgi:hypothetical protein